MNPCSFYCYWKPKNENKPDPDQIEETLKSYFGKGHVHRCLNRIDAQFVDSNLDGALAKLLSKEDCTIENWMLAEKCLGSLINQMKM